MREIARLLLVGGAILIVAGLVLMLFSKAGISRLLGDFAFVIPSREDGEESGRWNRAARPDSSLRSE